MVSIYCNTNKYEYDIRALVMGFFPGEEAVYNIGGDYGSTEGCNIIINLGDRRLKVNVTSGKGASLGLDDVCSDSIGSRLYRDVLKRLLYRALSGCLGRKLEWGTLTGVRPSKLPMKMLMDGYSYDEVIDRMMKEYYCTFKKAALCTEVAYTELRILNEIDFEQGYSIYIGIPFCPTVCSYCSFSSTPVSGVPGAEELMDAYMEALGKECRAVNNIYPDKTITSIYVGGGTPTALNEKQLMKLMDIVRDNFSTDTIREYTVEAGRPDSINEEKLRILKAGGVNRISVNPQTMRQETLDAIGRRHTVAQTIEAFRLARGLGFDNINMDLIAGLPGEDADDFLATLEHIRALKPDSFTVHSLVVKRASEYRQQKEQIKNCDTGEVCENDNITDRMLHMAADFAASEGYHPYYMYRQKNKAGLGDNPVLENVGYSMRGKEGIYNILIMEEKQTIIALGAGASGKVVYKRESDNNVYSVKRIANVKNISEYINRIDEMIERKKR